MRKFCLRVMIALLTTLILIIAIPVHADCSPSSSGGKDNIVCNTNPAPPPAGQQVFGDLGNDHLVVAGGTTVGGLDGDGDGSGGLANGNGGNDKINVNGIVTVNVRGDAASGNGGSDRIIINGSVGLSVFGDNVAGNGAPDQIIINGSVGQDVQGDSGGVGANDTITINGSVGQIIYGDAGNGNGGDDRITVNGTVGGNIYGDYINPIFAGGNDRITVNGTVGGKIICDGGWNSVLFNVEVAIGGNDTVTLGDGAGVGGIIDCGPGSDTLVFAFTNVSAADAALIQAAVDAANLNPGAASSLTYLGNTYNWQNIEQFVNATS